MFTLSMQKMLLKALGIPVTIGLVLCAGAGPQQASASLRGLVSDERGGRIVGATLIAIDKNGAATTTTSNIAPRSRGGTTASKKF